MNAWHLIALIGVCVARSHQRCAGHDVRIVSAEVASLGLAQPILSSCYTATSPATHLLHVPDGKQLFAFRVFVFR